VSRFEAPQLSWYSPVNPGDRLANGTAGMPSIVPVTPLASESGELGAGRPAGTNGLTGPKPVQLITTVLPAAAGAVAVGKAVIFKSGKNSSSVTVSAADWRYIHWKTPIF